MKSRIALLVSMGLMLACLAPAPLAADKEMTILTIAVFDAAKERPVPKASVTVNFVSGRKMLKMKKVRSEWGTKTNSKGLAELPEMPAGKIKVQVIAAGFQTFGDEYEITGPEHTITVRLKRPTGGQFSAHEPTEPAAEPPAAKKNP
ncbi:MAG: carboxypeptidase-like regulatory domain-containing protein [Gammaproteobacteria bacterium]